MFRNYFVIFSFLFAFIVVKAQNERIMSIECPFPEGQQDQGEAECDKYTACEWSDGVCHMRKNIDVGYVVMSDPLDTGRGFKVELMRNNPNLTLFGSDIENVTLEVIYHEEYHVQVKFTDSESNRYEVPVPMNLPVEPVLDSAMYNVSISKIGDPFVLKILRENGNTIFKSVGPLTYEDQFIQITTDVASTYLYGFGENYHSSFRHTFDPRTTNSIFAADKNTEQTNINSYGAHPYHMVMEDDEGNSHSILLLTSNAMEYSTFLVVDTENNTSPALTYRTIGGIIDMHFFMGPTPEDINSQYISMIGTPVFPPYWALGFHLSRWGYKDTTEIRDLRAAMKEKGIPQDVQTFDIDYMDGRRDFTIDPINFGDMDVLIEELHNDSLKATVILDPALSTEFSTYPPGDSGLIADAYIKWPDWSYVPNNQPAGALNYLVGRVWPKAPTVFIDYFNPVAQRWWIEEIKLLYQKLNFDSLWIDMNEPSCIGTNTISPLTYELQCHNTKWDDPPYTTMAVRTATGIGFGEGRLSDRTICMSSIHSDGTNEYNHYDVHSLYGWSEAEPTHRAMTEARPGLRALVMSRSTYPGSGKYSTHWLGDNKSDWEQMRISIIAMLEFNMFGIPFTGADVCGFNGNASEELCVRWTQLGAFYPFNRNHNAIGQHAQDPTQWDSVTETAKRYLSLRYRYNPYLYLLLHKSSMHGSSVVRPLSNVFPDDVQCRDVDDQFMWGDAIMIAPVLEEGKESRPVYFPTGIWYDLETAYEKHLIDEPGYSNVSAPQNKLLSYVRGGSILPWQEPEMTTTASRLNPFGLTVAQDSDRSAQGSIFWDDGESSYDNPMENSYVASVSYQKNNLTLTVNHGESIIAGWTLNTVVIYALDSSDHFSWATVNGESVDTVTWDSGLLVLTITFSAPMDKNIYLIMGN